MGKKKAVKKIDEASEIIETSTDNNINDNNEL